MNLSLGQTKIILSLERDLNACIRKAVYSKDNAFFPQWEKQIIYEMIAYFNSWHLWLKIAENEGCR